MILLASGRCDIVAFYSKWLLRRIEEGFVDVRNPYDPHQLSRIYLNEQSVDVLVFKFITGYETIEEALEYLFSKGIKLVIYTAGSDGASAFTKNIQAKTNGMKVQAKDTTGAGDGFIGSFLFQLASDEIDDLEALTERQLEKYLTFSNKFCSISVTKEGAIASYPTLSEC